MKKYKNNQNKLCKEVATSRSHSRTSSSRSICALWEIQRNAELGRWLPVRKRMRERQRGGKGIQKGKKIHMLNRKNMSGLMQNLLKVMSTGGFCFPPCSRHWIVPQGRVSEHGCCTRASAACAGSWEVAGAAASPGRDRAWFTASPHQWWSGSVKHGFSPASAPRELKTQPETSLPFEIRRWELQTHLEY